MPNYLPLDKFTLLLGSIQPTSVNLSQILNGLSLSVDDPLLPLLNNPVHISTIDDLKSILSPYHITKLLGKAIITGNATLFKEILSLSTDLSQINYIYLWKKLTTTSPTNSPSPSIAKEFLPYFEEQLKNPVFVSNVKEDLHQVQRHHFDIFSLIVDFLHLKVDVDYKAMSTLFAPSLETLYLFKKYNVSLGSQYVGAILLLPEAIKSINSVNDLSELDYDSTFKSLALPHKIGHIKKFIKSVDISQSLDSYIKTFSIFIDYLGEEFLAKESDKSSGLLSLYQVLLNLPPTPVTHNLLAYLSAHHAPSLNNTLSVFSEFFNMSPHEEHKEKVVNILKNGWGLDYFNSVIKSSSFFERLSLNKDRKFSPRLIINLYRCNPGGYDAEFLAHNILSFFMELQLPIITIKELIEDILKLPQTTQSKDSLSLALSKFFKAPKILEYERRINLANVHPLKELEMDYLNFITSALEHISHASDLLEIMHEKTDYVSDFKIKGSRLHPKIIFAVESYIEKIKISSAINSIESSPKLSKSLKI